MSSLKFVHLPVFAFICSMAFAPSACAKNYLVKNQGGFDKAVKKLKPGDVLVLKSGTWKNAKLKLKAVGTADAPITVMAQEAGKVFLTGQSSLSMGGEHLIVTGLTFKNGYTPSAQVVDFRADSSTPCFKCRFVQNVIVDYNKPGGAKDFWVVMRGKNNKVDHNFFTGKTNEGPVLTVRLDAPENIENKHLIARNFFGYRQDLGRNGGETIRVGTSSHMTKTSETKIAQNYFEQTNGEAEIISIKSRGNSIVENTFFESEGALVMRQGGNTLVARNVFFGGGLERAGGIRIISDTQTVRGNYIEGVGGNKNRSALAIMNGVPNSPAHRYNQVENAKISNNSFYNVATLSFGTGASAELSLPPVSTVFSDNIITSGGSDIVDIQAPIAGITFTGNRADFSNGQTGLTASGLSPIRAANGLLYPESGTAGAPRDLKPVTRDITGPSWFKKPGPVSASKIKARRQALKAAQ